MPDLYEVGSGTGDMDFIGFSFNGVHSNNLGITRVSNGTRYEDTLTPNFKDTTAEIAGGDGTLYWDSFDTNRTFNIQFAFDNLSELQYRRLRQVFNGKAYGALIFDEAPYKQYSVKVQSPIQLTSLCFEEGGARVQKGEGSIAFVAQYPQAKSVHKYLNEYTPDTAFPNKSQWEAASEMLATKGSYDSANKTSIKIYNPGDLPVDWNATFVPNGNFALSCNGKSLSGNISALKTGDTKVRVNSRANLIEGVDNSGNLTGNLYNECITSGDFFQIPIWTSTSSNLNFTSSQACTLEYDYLYY